jgi:NADH:ubiquinone oxidoreductase subunit 6 (subunit J)
MSFDLVLLFFFSFCLIFNSLFIVAGINSIYSIFLLVFLFVLSTGLLFLLESEFMALIFIIIYIGAISVLFLFVILMLDLKTKNYFNLYDIFPSINIVILVFFFSMFIIIFNNYTKNYYMDNFLYNYNINWLYKIECITDLNSLGQILYTYYVIQFLILGILLLLAIIGAVTLTFNRNNFFFISSQNQEIFRQISR